MNDFRQKRHREGCLLSVNDEPSITDSHEFASFWCCVQWVISTVQNRCSVYWVAGTTRHAKVGMVPMVRENQSTRVHKLTKMEQKFWTVLHRLCTTVHNFFWSLRLLIICVYTFLICSAIFVSSAIESQHWYFAWTN